MVLSFLGRNAASQLVYSNKKQNDPKRNGRMVQRGLYQLKRIFFLLLCRYKVGLLEEDLAARFRIYQSLVSKIVVSWSKFMYHRFEELNIFPDREIIK